MVRARGAGAGGLVGARDVGTGPGPLGGGGPSASAPPTAVLALHHLSPLIHPDLFQRSYLTASRHTESNFTASQLSHTRLSGLGRRTHHRARLAAAPASTCSTAARIPPRRDGSKRRHPLDRSLPWPRETGGGTEALHPNRFRQFLNFCFCGTVLSCRDALGAGGCAEIKGTDRQCSLSLRVSEVTVGSHVVGRGLSFNGGSCDNFASESLSPLFLSVFFFGRGWGCVCAGSKLGSSCFFFRFRPPKE